MAHRHPTAVTLPDSGRSITRGYDYNTIGQPLQVFLLGDVERERARGIAGMGDEKEGYDPRQFMAWMQREMRRRDWIPADVARELDMNPGQISQWLTGKKQPGTLNARRLADLFAVDQDTMLILTGHLPGDQVDDETARLIGLLKRVDLAKNRRGELLNRMLLGFHEEDRSERRSQTANREATD